MSKTISLRDYKSDDYWSFQEVTLLDSGSIILTDYTTFTNKDGTKFENNNLICLIPEQLEKLKELLKESL